MWSLLKIELFKVFRRPRTYIAFIAVWAIVSLIQIAIYVDGAKYIDFVLKDVKDNFDIIGNPLNGYFVCFIILQTLLIHVPLLVALVSADMIAGEANMGTLRLLITKPISRTKLLLSKFLASSVYAVILLIWIAILGLFLSMLIFGTDGLLNAKSYEIIILNGNDIFWRYILAFAFAAIALITVAALGFFFSIFAENSLGPIVATMSVIIVFTILTTLDIPLFQSVKHLFFTSHMIGWKGFFEMKLDADGVSIPGTIRNLPAVLRSAGVLLLHTFLFVGGAIFIFNRKDVLS
ncbi:MAG: ABC transporter permease subunit [Chitinophagaceae bacterium]|nr:ABC transporter permease subunit [Chitinophagaceae bacterium]